MQIQSYYDNCEIIIIESMDKLLFDILQRSPVILYVHWVLHEISNVG